MQKFDVVVVGGATAGSFVAKRMTEKGFSVLVLEKNSRDKNGDRYDIFHIADADFDRFCLPKPQQGDKDFAFTFENSLTISPNGNYPKHTTQKVVGMHMKDYVSRLNLWAEESGAQFSFDSSFDGFVWKDGKIDGVNYTQNGEKKQVGCRLVIDASGIAAQARTKLPDGFGVENTPLTADDVFFVTLRYVKYLNEKDYVSGSRGWTFFKAWEAPQSDEKGAILGIGSCKSFENGDKVFSEMQKSVVLPDYVLDHVEKGTTPYTRCPYSFVGDGFVAVGDAACLTKPTNGEGVTSAMVQMEIVADVASRALQSGDVSKENLWKINVDYNKAQGAEFAFVRALFVKAVSASKEEFEFWFKEDILFSAKFLSGAKMSVFDYAAMGLKIVGGVLGGKMSGKTFKALKQGLSLGGKLQKLYLAFPESPSGFDEWCKKADQLWAAVGKMSDNG